MNTPRDWGDDSERFLPPDRELSRRMIRGVVVLLVLFAVLAAGWALWPLLSGHEASLANPRQLLQNSLARPLNERPPFLHQAERTLRHYLHRGGRHEDSARLLLCSVLSLHSHRNPDAPVTWELEIDELLDKLQPRACSIDDLRTAIDVFIHAGQLAQADWLMGPALARQHEMDPEVYHRLLRLAADLRYDLGREQAVFEHCHELARLDPSDPEPWRLMALVHEDGGYTERFVQSLDKVIELDSGDVSRERLQLLASLITLGERIRAREQFSLLQAEAPELLVKQPLIEAKLLLLEGETARAQAIIQGVLENEPANTEAIVVRTKLHLSQREFAEAVELLEPLLRAEPTHPEAHFLIGQAHARLGQIKQAQFHVDRHRLILDTRVQLHRLERVAGRNPRDVQARQEIVRLYRMLGMHDLADFWQRAVDSAQYGDRAGR
jgi:tetratricopeptide (TPR) repeat protein